MGATVWLTGLPSSGKSTLAAAVAEAVRTEQPAVEVLDGDHMRRSLFPELGYSKDDRAENVRRIGHVARMLTRHGVFTIVPVIAPFQATRVRIRSEHEAEGLTFVEVFVDASLETCMDRDVKGLYARARRQEITGLTGYDDPYEKPMAPEVHVRTDSHSTDECVRAILEWTRS